MNKRTLSLAALTLLDVPPPEQVRIAARTGFTHVGLRLLPATPTDPDYDNCGHRLSSCRLRFDKANNGNGVLRFGGFPAAGLIRG